MKKMLILSAVVILSLSNLTSFADQKLCTNKVSQQGCCSWHNGVCGCSGGRKVCCDGTFSPSCTCKKDEFKNEQIEEKMLNINKQKGIKS